MRCGPSWRTAGSHPSRLHVQGSTVRGIVAHGWVDADPAAHDIAVAALKTAPPASPPANLLANSALAGAPRAVRCPPSPGHPVPHWDSDRLGKTRIDSDRLG